MPVSKIASLRYRLLHACFANKQKRYWTKQELIDKLASHDLLIKSRTLNNDIEAMRHDERLGFHAPIAFCRKERAFHYTDPDFSINELQLSDDELNALWMAVQLVQQYQGTQLVRHFEGAIDKVVQMVKRLREPAAREPFIAYEEAPYYRGIHYLDVLTDAIARRKPQRIAYQKFNAKQSEDHVFHPYLLKEFKDRWYVLGYSDARNNVITLALDRIEGITAEPIRYKTEARPSSRNYFKNTIGITHAQGPVEEIILWFSPQQGHYIKTQHLHSTQQVMQDDDTGLVIKLKLIINYEFTSLLLGFCPEVEVRQPVHLRQQLHELLEKGLKRNFI
jgi:predicted DNA-binding transcriptional regulator YafY